MAHFAKLDSENIVTEVVEVADAAAPDEATGVALLKSLHELNVVYSIHCCSPLSSIKQQEPNVCIPSHSPTSAPYPLAANEAFHVEPPSVVIKLTISSAQEKYASSSSK